MADIRPARQEDLDAVWALARRAVAWMNDQGNPQWGEDYPTRTLYQGDIARGELYAAWAGELLLGVACINTDQSPEYAQVDWAVSGPAMVVHRMAVDPQVQGQGVGRRLLAYAEELARSRGLPVMHVDTYSQNHRMQHLFERQGFCRRGEIHLHGRPLPYPCFEKILTAQRVDCNLPHSGL